MVESKHPEPLHGAGEYGATTVDVTKDGSALRIAFGRNAPSGKVFYGAMILSPEAALELEEQLAQIKK